MQYNNLVEEFELRNMKVMHLAESKVAEYEFISNIIALNTLDNDQLSTDPALVFKVEAQIASLNYETVADSFTLSFWRTNYGPDMIVAVLADIVVYFLRQFQLKDSLNYNQVIQIVAKLLMAHPMLRVKELIFVLNNALNSEYGHTYQRIGIDTFLGWLARFLDDSSLYFEIKRTNAKPDESRGDTPWDVLERRTQQYQQELKQKAETNTKLYAAEKRKREIEDELARLRPELANEQISK